MAAFPIFDACTFIGPWPQHADLTLESLLGVMNQNGIARAMTLSTRGIFHDFRAANEEAAEAARSNPQLLPSACLDPRAYPACLEEVEKCAARGFRLMRFFPDRQNWPLKFQPFRELIQKCDELSVTLAVNVSRPGEATELADMVAFTQAPLLFSGVTSLTLGEVIAVLRTSPKFHLETTHLVAPGALEAVAREVPSGSERLVFSSHAPLRYLSAALGPVLASGLTPDQKAAVLGGNLKRLVTK